MRTAKTFNLSSIYRYFTVLPLFTNKPPKCSAHYQANAGQGLALYRGGLFVNVGILY